MTTTIPTTPLTHVTGGDVWAPVPIGVDPATGDTVTLTLGGSGLLVDGPDRAGRTNIARLAVAAAALDPTVRLIVFDGQAGPDWHPFALVAPSWGAGTADEVVEHLAEVLNATAADLKRRHDRLADDDVDPSDRPAVVRALAGADASMAPVVIAINDLDRYTAHATWGADIARCLVRIARSGSRVGVSLVVTTTGATGVARPWPRDLPDIRVAFGGVERETATIHNGSGPRAMAVRAHRLDHDTLTALIDRARQVRRTAGGGPR